MLAGAPAAGRLACDTSRAVRLVHAGVERVYPQVVDDAVGDEVVAAEDVYLIHGKFSSHEAQRRRVVGRIGLVRVPGIVDLVEPGRVNIAGRATPDHHEVADVESEVAEAKRQVVGQVELFVPLRADRRLRCSRRDV